MSAPYSARPGRPVALVAALALCAAGGFAAAQEAGVRPAAGGAESSRKAQPWLEERRSPGKPLGPIAVSYALAGEPALGVPLTVEIRVRAHRALGDVAVELRPAAGLVVGPRAAAARAALAAGETLEQTVTVTPLATGALRLGVLVEADIGGRRQARSLTIPLTIGAAVDAPARRSIGTPRTDAAGRTVISLPAEEPQ